MDVMSYLRFEFVCKDVVCEIFNFGGEVHRVSNFKVFLFNVVMGVEP